VDDLDDSAKLTLQVAEEEQGKRLDHLLAKHFPDISRSRIKALIVDGKVTVDGAVSKAPALRVKTVGAAVEMHVPPTVSIDLLPQDLPLDILFEDEHLIIINKAAGMVVHPAPGHPDGTLVNALLHHCGESLLGIGGERRPGIVHRLDKDTSGVMVAAKHQAAHEGLSALFAKHDLERTYQAVLWGAPSPTSGVVEGAIGRDRMNRKKMAVDLKHGKDAITHYQVLKHLGLGATVVACTLETGRTHQIRVHMSAIGHSLMGDPLYGRASPARKARFDEEQQAAISGFPRQALHAAVLGFVHPMTKDYVRFESELPTDMKNLIDALS
jgi:23S rRNA pseudouridine1911/1915/1917 synthase